MPKNEIVFYKIRDFGQKFNDSIEYIRWNILELIQVVLLIALPMGILMALFLSNMFESMGGLVDLEGSNDTAGSLAILGSLGVNYVIVMTFSLIATGMLVGTVYSYMKLSQHSEGKPSFSQVYQEMFKILPGLVMLIILISILSFIGFFFFILPGFYLMITLSLAIPIYIFKEDQSIGSAISSSFKYVKDKWWSTFGLLLVSMMIASTISYIFAIPMYVAMFAEIFTLASSDPDPEAIINLYSGWKMSAGMGLVMVGSYITYLVPMVALAFQYFNLSERLEATGLRGQIENFENIG